MIACGARRLAMVPILLLLAGALAGVASAQDPHPVEGEGPNGGKKQLKVKKLPQIRFVVQRGDDFTEVQEEVLAVGQPYFLEIELRPQQPDPPDNAYIEVGDAIVPEAERSVTSVPLQRVQPGLLRTARSFQFSFESDASSILVGDQERLRGRVAQTRGDLHVDRRSPPYEGPRIPIRFRLYSTEKESGERRLRLELRDRLQWWIDSINRHCRDAFALLERPRYLGHDGTSTLFRQKGRKRVELIKFVTLVAYNASENEKWDGTGAYRWIKGRWEMRGLLDAAGYAEREPNTFHIVIVKEIYANREANSVPGKNPPGTNMLLLTRRSDRNDRWHEVGHLFGLEDDPYGSESRLGGIMAKEKVKKAVRLVPHYRPEDETGWVNDRVATDRCRRIEAYLDPE